MAETATITPGDAGLSVTDLARSLGFYREVLGLEVVHHSADAGRRFAFLGGGGRIFLTLWEQSTQPFEPRTAGLHHLAFQVPTLEAVEAAEARLRGRGISPHYDGMVAQSEGSESASLFFLDPDGIRLEIYCPTGAAGLAAPVAGAPSCGFF